MAYKSEIEWTDSTWPIITGCSPVSEGCRHCYAARLAATRLKHHRWYEGLASRMDDGKYQWTGEVRFNEDVLDAPWHWRKPRRIFVCPTGDFFNSRVLLEWQARVLKVINWCSQHTFIFLTKRPHLMKQFEDVCGGLNRPNIWLGVSISNQDDADRFIPELLATPAAVRFVSVEPLLSAVDLTEVPMPDGGGLDLVIAGCETGPSARPAELDWFREFRDHCADVNIPFFLKAVTSKDKRGILDGELCREWPARKGIWSMQERGQ